jgi:23S rRNA (pseudouridine1915-N3)-methyltransferase
VKLTVLAVGKLRDAWAEAGCAEYLKRLRAKLPTEIVEVKDAQSLGRRVPARARLWALDERGHAFSSAQLAAAIGREMNAGTPGLAFAIGGADGLPRALVEGAAQAWSLGPLTLPHRLARLVVLEQLYRALSIVRGEPYHRG